MGGRELGVSTTEGIIFLGSTGREGRAKVLLFYGDIPYVETGKIVPAGGGLYRIELDVTHQGVPISLQWPRAGEEFLMMGIKDGTVWKEYTRLANEKGIYGAVFEFPEGLDLDPSQAGAGIFRIEKNGLLSLVGLVKGIAELEPKGSKWICAAGLQDLKECMIAKRKILPEKKVIHRPDMARPIIRR